jgi:hypothetical protein
MAINQQLQERSVYAPPLRSLCGTGGVPDLAPLGTTHDDNGFHVLEDILQFGNVSAPLVLRKIATYSRWTSPMLNVASLAMLLHAAS